MAGSFDYNQAFSRNIGWLTAGEQHKLKSKRIAIAGLGGVGGAHLLALTRLGIGAFTIADFDTFEMANFNRQAGATTSSLGRSKTSVMAAAARDINPELDIRVFEDGVNEENVTSFLDGADVLIDGFDFFNISIRRIAFARAYELAVPAVTAAPLGMGAAYLVFMPGGMSFEEYFRFEGEPKERQYVKFALGLAPAGLHRRHLVDPSRLDLSGHRGPSTMVACDLCAGVAAAETLKVLLNRGRIKPAPWYHQFDPFCGRFVSRRIRRGNANPLQRIKIALGSRYARRLAANAAPESEVNSSDDPLMRVLDTARWAPSGDNEQPWHFEIRADDAVRIHLMRQKENIYEYADGRPILLAAGMLLETMALAAAREGYRIEWTVDDERVTAIDVALTPDPSVKMDPLVDVVPVRSVDRRPYQGIPLAADIKASLEQALADDDLEIAWCDSARDCRQITAMNMRATRLRLTLPECQKTHKAVIDHERDFSAFGIPAAAVGLDPITTWAMRWVNAAWWRTRLVNGWLGGAWLASLELDVRQGLSSEHFVIRWKEGDRKRNESDWIRAGRAVQRFWLMATQLELAVQPSFSPLIFAYNAAHGISVSSKRGADRSARRILGDYRRNYGSPEKAVFPGRIGRPQSSKIRSRSLRLPLSELVKKTAE